ncbi:MAG TPA: type II toxin-antitoxin system RelE/ParE family toxin [Mobilitalea sp.]|nr:type II toxin-antitoxin system RelE/ParE family toxin [Mobilitalea sp.]
MDQYSIRIYKKAQEDLEEIVLYLNRFYAETALKYYDLIVEKINGLSIAPKRCALVRDDSIRLKNYWYLLVENYIVLFMIKERTVQIRRILYNKREYEDIL